jgi:tryptophan halogenase
MQKPIRSVGVVGGGTAGYLTALSLRRRFPAWRIEVITAPDIPAIGVGESTVFQLVDFLHGHLGIDVSEFYRAVQPTWKLGQRFYWGPAEREWFNYTFQRVDHEVAHLDGADFRTSTLYSTLMEGRRTFLVSRKTADGGTETVAVKRGTYSYQLNNQPFIRFLRERVPREGISLQDARIVEARRSADGREVEEVVTADGRTFRHDLWVDCSGFRSLLLEKTLGVPWVDFGSSLLTDRAVTARVANGGTPFPGTRSHTAPNGWVWNIPMRNEDNLGYVYSSAFADTDHAEEWLVRKFGATLDGVEIPFRTGRHERAWEGNVVAVGNASGFVEPLQSTGLQMTTIAINRMGEVLESGSDWRDRVAGYNREITARWDFLRWFIALHYRLNRRATTPFWKACNETLDLGPFVEIVRFFSERGPLSADGSGAREEFRSIWESGLFGPHGVDLMLLGLGKRPGARHGPPTPARVTSYRRRQALWKSIVPAALPLEEALRVAEAHPDLVWPRAAHRPSLSSGR